MTLIFLQCNLPYFTSGYFFYQLCMRGTLSTAGVHDLVYSNRPEFVAMAVKQPEVREVCMKSLNTLVRVE